MSSAVNVEINQATFRSVVGHFPTGVVVVSCQNESGTHAITLQSFQSLSLEPALISISISKSSKSWPPIKNHGSFSISFLEQSHSQVALQISRKDGGDKFENVETELSPNLNHPIIKSGTAWVECAIENTFDAGDHEIVVGRVVDLDLLELSLIHI